MGQKLLDELFNFIENDFVDTDRIMEEESEEGSKSENLLERIKISCNSKEKL